MKRVGRGCLEAAKVVSEVLGETRRGLTGGIWHLSRFRHGPVIISEEFRRAGLGRSNERDRIEIYLHIKGTSMGRICLSAECVAMSKLDTGMRKL